MTWHEALCSQADHLVQGSLALCNSRLSGGSQGPSAPCSPGIHSVTPCTKPLEALLLGLGCFGPGRPPGASLGSHALSDGSYHLPVAGRAGMPKAALKCIQVIAVPSHAATGNEMH